MQPTKRMVSEKKKPFDKSAYQRDYMARKAREGREITIRECADPARRERLLSDPVGFLKHYFEAQFYRPFSEDQVEAIGHIITAAELGADEIICAPRGDWKTETTKGLVVYMILNRIIKFPVIIGATASDASLKYNDIKRKFESPRLAEDFPEICDPIIALDRSSQKARRQTFGGVRTDFEWREDYVTFPRIEKVPGTDEPSPYGDCAMTFRGLDGAIRGINLFGRRPDLAFCDDLETSESARQDGQIATRESLLDKDVGGLDGGGGGLARVVLGTIQNSKCLTKRKLDQWGGKRYQGVKQWPNGPRSEELRDEYVAKWMSEKESGSKLMPEAHQFYLDNQAEIEHGMVLGNPHNFSSKRRPDGSLVEVSGFQRICNLIARMTTKEQSGMEYVLTEVQNDPPEEQQMESLGLTYSKVMSRISGFKQKEPPTNTQFLTATMDLGKYACHWEIKAWLDGLTGTTINYGVAEVHGIGTQSDQAHVDMAIRRTLHQWREELLRGEHCPEVPANVLIDSGTPILGSKTGQGEHADVVYGFMKEVQDGTSTFKASKGMSPYRSYQEIEGKRIVGNHWHASLQEEHGVWLYNLDTDWLKNMIHQMWLTPTFDEAQQFSPMSLSLFSATDEMGKPDTRRHLSFAKHQVAEEFRQQFFPGKGLKRWWHKVNANNHFFDASYMNLAAAIMLGMWIPLDNTPAPPPEPTPPRKTEPSSQFQRQSGEPFIARKTA